LFGKERAKRIATTEVTRLFAIGAIMAATEDQTIGGYVWNTAKDEAVCTRCSPLDGQIFSKNQIPMIPAHVNCLSGDTLVASAGRIAAASKRWYEGDMLFIRTSTGDELTVTPNHPILTERGWVAAQFLQPRDQIFHCSNVETLLALVSPNNQQVPTLIKDIFSTFVSRNNMVASGVPTSTKDFHGDGTNGEVDIVYSKRELRGYGDTFEPTHIGKLNLVLTHSGSMPSPNREVNSFSNGSLTPSHGFMGSVGLLEPLPGIHKCPFHNLGFGLASDMNIGRDEDSADGTTASTKSLTNGILRSSKFIELTDIISINVFSFNGHVYNLQTDLGWYIGNNIITHNCRCSLQPASWQSINKNPTKWQGGGMSNMDAQRTNLYGGTV
jgi:hypothetical protein